MSFYREMKVKHIRKDTNCFGCRKVIPKGRSMMYSAGTWEGEFFAGHMCHPCFKELNRGDYRDGYSDGDLREGRWQRVSDWKWRREHKATAKEVPE